MVGIDRRKITQIIYLSPIFTTLVLIIFYPISVFAVDAIFEWDYDNNSNVLGFRVYMRQEDQSYDYSNIAWEGIDTTCTISGLNLNTVFCFVVRAYNKYGESQDSTELCTIFRQITGDFDIDADFDGSDLAAYALGFAGISLEDFVSDFGRSDCQF
jgi:ABC-type sugar transport system permease subunit